MASGRRSARAPNVLMNASRQLASFARAGVGGAGCRRRSRAARRRQRRAQRHRRRRKSPRRGSAEAIDRGAGSCRADPAAPPRDDRRAARPSGAAISVMTVCPALAPPTAHAARLAIVFRYCVIVRRRSAATGALALASQANVRSGGTTLAPPAPGPPTLPLPPRPGPGPLPAPADPEEPALPVPVPAPVPLAPTPFTPTWPVQPATASASRRYRGAARILPSTTPGGDETVHPRGPPSVPSPAGIRPRTPRPWLIRAGCSPSGCSCSAVSASRPRAPAPSA